MGAYDWIAYLLLALLAGVLGQLIRVAVGMKKLHDKNVIDGVKTPFDRKKFWISIALGGLAAAVTAVATWDATRLVIEREFLLSLMAAGYAGSDLLEGLIERWTKDTPPSLPTASSGSTL